MFLWLRSGDTSGFASVGNTHIRNSQSADDKTRIPTGSNQTHGTPIVLPIRVSLHGTINFPGLIEYQTCVQSDHGLC
jgi:hypothetical protein